MDIQSVSYDEKCAPSVQTPLPHIMDMSLDGLTAWMTGQGEKSFRAVQVWDWMYKKRVWDPELMSNMPPQIRQDLSHSFSIAPLTLSVEQKSVDGTRKWLFRMADGNEIETVFIPEETRGTLCISSQIGCTLTCSFCHTGTQLLVRNLTPHEIIQQLMLAQDRLALEDSPYSITNIVMMGMGEPLYNYDHVKTALTTIMHPKGLGMSRRRITLSTSGVVPRIVDCGQDLGVNLAISLHGVTDAMRTPLVPLNRKYPLAELIQACRDYARVVTDRRITFEYVMLKGVNDRPDDARALVQLIRGIPAKVNLIPFNPWPGSGYVCSDKATIRAFASIVERAGYMSPVRTPRGQDILAACGQLKSESQRVRKHAMAN